MSASAVASAIAARTSFSALSSFLARCVVLRLTIPRTGRRNEKIQPTPGTGFPPMRRPGSKSHSYSAWNSWKESLETTVAPVRFAICSRNPSPRPTAPAGGDTTSLATSTFAKAPRSDGSMRCSKLASTTTVTTDPGCSPRKAATASRSWARLGSVRPSVARLEPSITKWSAIRR